MINIKELLHLIFLIPVLVVQLPFKLYIYMREGSRIGEHRLDLLGEDYIQRQLNMYKWYVFVEEHQNALCVAFWMFLLMHIPK